MFKDILKHALFIKRYIYCIHRFYGKKTYEYKIDLDFTSVLNMYKSINDLSLKSIL